MRDADERLVHALLLTRAEKDRAARLERVTRALEEPAPRRRLRALFSASLAAAASLLALLPLVFMSADAEARALEELIEELDRRDQTFLIEVLDGPAPPLRPRAALRELRELRGPRRFPRPAPPSLDGGRLYVRGAQYLLSRDTPLGRPALHGFDGATTWAWHPRFGWNEGLPARRTPLPEEVSDLLVLDLRELLSTVLAGYELRSLREGEASGLVHLAASRRSGADGPSSVELTFDPATGQLHELVCAGLRLRHGPRQLALRLSFVSDEPLPADWFEPRGHGR